MKTSIYDDRKYMSQNQPTVAISGEFLDAFARLPRNVQNKATRFVSKFRQDPTMPGINYEKIQKTKTPGFRSVRIGDEYRGVVLKPEHENVYVLLWVDHHDEAYAWARRKKCAVHPETGSLQIYETLEQTDLDLQAEAQPDSRATGLFDDIHDRHLRRFGVPEELLPRVRRITTQAELEAFLHILPQEAYEALFFLSEGFSLQEVYQETGKSESEAEVDTTDILAALESPDSKQRFHVVSDDLELQSMLQAPLEKWRVFLHPTQRKLVERNWNGSVRVLGEAGTGKTVAAMHRAKWLARYAFTEPGDQILFTTFTRNLAADIQNNLRSLCSQEELEHIEVVNLDKWVSDFLKRTGYISTIVYEQQTETLWEQALAAAPEEPALTASFYREEWASVLQPQGVTSFEEYSKASRKGRGVPLSRKARKAVWPVFEEYRLLLNDQGWREPDDAMRDARHVLESKKMGLPYKAVIVDEAQDMGTQAFKLVRQMVPEGENDIFIVGDGHQRIYRHRVVLGQCGIKIVGRSRKLRVNYRTTEETRRWATDVLKGLSIDNLDAEPDEEKGTTSLLRGVNPTIETFSSFDDECRYLTQVAREKESEGALGTACLVTRTNAQKERYKRTLEDQGIPTYSLTRSKAEDRTAPGLRLATMHRVKGLEFDTIIIAGANKGVMPLDMAMGSTSDPAEYEDKELRERALFYVAATRAKKDVIVTCFGTPSPFLER